MAVAVVEQTLMQQSEQSEQVRYDPLVIREEKEALLERLEALALESAVEERPRTREAALQTVHWAIDTGHLPRELRQYPWGMDYLAQGLAAQMHSRKGARHPFADINRSMGWYGMDGLPRLVELPERADIADNPRPLPPALRPEGLRPLETTWKVAGRFMRLGEMTGADYRRKADRAYRLMVSNERTYRLMDGLAQQVGEAERGEDALTDDDTYRLAVDILGHEAAHAILGRRSGEGDQELELELELDEEAP